ncbi:MAG: hypothetical protein H7A23_21780 [Leptospiraceae bacterium]|nr:hypothetical protein [Leptospiraceae bacterium]MCP5497192.1 hypothetical protein [Leptospiraceae bacterium]
MEKKLEVCFTIKPVWETISQIREDFQKVLKLKRVSNDILEKADVVCLELLENAVKYGVITPDCPDVKISFELEENTLKFFVSNGVMLGSRLQYLFHLIDKLKNSDDVESLYIQRLEEIAKHPKGGSQLGIYRVVYESGFGLSYNLDGQKLTVIAQKEVIREVI